MRSMLLAMVAVAAVSLSGGAVLAEQVVVCSPSCGVVPSSEAQNLKQNQGKSKASEHISDKGATQNNAGIAKPTSGSGDGGGTIMIFF